MRFNNVWIDVVAQELKHAAKIYYRAQSDICERFSGKLGKLNLPQEPKAR